MRPHFGNRLLGLVAIFVLVGVASGCAAASNGSPGSGTRATVTPPVQEYGNAPRTRDSLGGPNRRSSQRHAEAPFVARSALNGPDFLKVTPIGASQRLAADIVVPDKIGAAAIDGLYVPDLERPGSAGAPSLIVVYDNDLVIYVDRRANSGEASAAAAANVGTGSSLGRFVSRRALHGVSAYVLPRLDIPPVYEPTSTSTGEAPVLPGTGISSNSAEVRWAKGPFVITVMCPSMTTDELVSAALLVSIEPRTR